MIDTDNRQGVCSEWREREINARESMRERKAKGSEGKKRKKD